MIKLQNYPYNYADSSNSEINNSSSNADEAGKTDALANLWFRMFNSAAKSPRSSASNLKKNKKNDFPNKLSLFLKVNPDK